MAREPIIRAFFDEPTNTVSYLVWDPATRQAAVIDPVLDYDHNAGEVDTRSADAILAAATEEGVTIRWVLETHAHADHLTAAPYIKAKTGAPDRHRRAHQGRAAHLPPGVRRPRPEDRGRRLRPPVPAMASASGSAASRSRCMHTPGHTPADIAYRIGDDVFVGDTLFMPDYGTARADFPGGDAHQLFRSIRGCWRCRRRRGC